MDNDDLTPWNPAHFGHTDFQQEPDGQLTIFFEGTNEPPDPDDFASIADYKIAWAEWEQTQILPQQEDKIMNFNITTPFDSEIELLKAKLAELETQKHRVSTCANRIVEQVGECVIEMKEAGVSDEILNNWACLIYKEITGQDVPAPSNSDVLKGAIAWEEKYNQIMLELNDYGNQIKAANTEIGQLQSANFELTAMLETAVAQRDHCQEELQKLQSGNSEGTEGLFKINLLKKVSDLTIERDTALEKSRGLTALNLRVSEELDSVRASLAIANKEAFDAREELADLTMQRISDNHDNSVIEGYKKTVVELTIANQKLCEKLNNLSAKSPQPQEESAYKAVFESMESGSQSSFVIGDFVLPLSSDFSNHPNGRVIYLLEDDEVIVSFYETRETKACEISFGINEIKLHPANERLKIEENVSKFLKKLDRTRAVEKLDWVKIKNLPLNIETMRELGLQVSSKSKAHNYLLEKMPVMCASYISETGDKSDLEWLPKSFVERVEYLLKMESLGAGDESTGEEEKTPRSTSLSEVKPAIQRGDTVRLIGLDSVCRVLDVNGKWLNVQDDDGFTDMWDISDVELVAELAA